MPKPLVSAIIPTHNHAQHLSRALDSIYAQEDRDDCFEVEVIVVDDASSDATPEVVSLYPLVRYLRLPQRQGVSAAQNAGIRASTGEYISFLGADDAWLPHKIRVQLPLLLEHSQVAVVYSQTLLRCRGTELLFPDIHRARSGWVFDAMLNDNFAGHFASLLVRREAFNRTGYFNESLVTHEDYDMSLRLALYFPFLFEPGAVTIYNLSTDGLSFNRAVSGAASQDRARVVENAIQMLPHSARSRKMLQEAPIRIAYDAVSPFVLTGDLTQAWLRLLAALRAYPSSGRLGWARAFVIWVAHNKLVTSASLLTEARDLCTDIQAATLGGGVRGRWFARWMLAEVWSAVLFFPELRRRLNPQGAVYAAVRALTCSPEHIVFGALRLGGRLLGKWLAELCKRIRKFA